MSRLTVLRYGLGCFVKSKLGFLALSRSFVKMGFMSWLTKASLRVGAVAAAVKISIDNDVWSMQTDVTEQKYGELKKNIMPGAIVYKEKLPQNEELETAVGSKWNDSVNCAFKFLNNAPEIANKKLNEMYKSAEKFRS